MIVDKGMHIFIDRSGQQFGPYSVDECLAFLSDERLLDQDLAWREGMEQWQPLHVVLRAALEEAAALGDDGPMLKVATSAATEKMNLKKTMKVTLPDEWEPINDALPPGWTATAKKTPPPATH